MGDSTIGIKIADGTYYPILVEGDPRGKKVILTTVKDDQSSVQIDLYKGQGEDIAMAEYIGSLMIDSIAESPQGDPEIELVMGIDEQGNLNAQASDTATGERQSLSVSMESLDEDGIYDIPDFSIDDSFEPEAESPAPPRTELFADSDGDSDMESESGQDMEEVERKRHPLLLAAFVIVGLAIIALVVVLVFRQLRAPDSPRLEAADEQRVEVAADETTPTEPAETAETEEAVQEEQTVEETPEIETPAEGTVRKATDGGVWYWIRWGDTLWDISISFYRTPWLYGKIARENSIKNPDLIYAGTKIYIPEN